jgi:hypothetical protein
MYLALILGLAAPLGLTIDQPAWGSMCDRSVNLNARLMPLCAKCRGMPEFFSTVIFLFQTECSRLFAAQAKRMVCAAN